MLIKFQINRVKIRLQREYPNGTFHRGKNIHLNLCLESCVYVYVCVCVRVVLKFSNRFMNDAIIMHYYGLFGIFEPLAARQITIYDQKIKYNSKIHPHAFTYMSYIMQYYMEIF